MKNLLVILDSMNCGGAETYVYSLTKILKQYCNVFVISSGGKLVESLESNGIKHFNMNLSNLNQNIIEENKNRITDIIEENKIDFVNIHPFATYYPSVWACIESKTPYILTIHDAIGRKALEYIDDAYTLFLQSIVYKFASKIIVVTKECRERYTLDFFIDENSISIIPNSIDSNIFKETCKCNSRINKFLIVSRLDTDKKVSVLNAIDFYIYVVNKLNIKDNCSLKIAGVGNEFNEIKEYVSKLKSYNIIMLGNVTDVVTIINESDVVLGMGRCLLEGVFCKRICILSGYDELKCVVNKDNIFDLSMNNFSGRNYEGKDKEQLYDELSKVLSNNLYENLQEAYNAIKYGFELNENSKKIWNVFESAEDKKYNDTFVLKLIDEFFLLRNKIMYIKECDSKLIDENKNINNRNSDYEKEIAQLNKNITILKNDLEHWKLSASNNENQLNAIYNSRMWKLVRKYYKIKDFLKSIFN